jgi:hypothetical protein
LGWRALVGGGTDASGLHAPTAAVGAEAGWCFIMLLIAQLQCIRVMKFGASLVASAVAARLLPRDDR